MVRRGWLRLLGLGLATACALLYIYYYSSAPPTPQVPPVFPKDDAAALSSNIINSNVNNNANDIRASHRAAEIILEIGKGQAIPSHQCSVIKAPKTDVNTVTQFPKFEFQVSTILVTYYRQRSNPVFINI